ncbi:MBOAT family O-acyltransferase [Neolewinella persica]|uniref:MBOAT family O-acyltransferase n=1 Tax=Neolewinella persica TaxID=70998 RepID=UPI000360B6E7|nr:MBOAT family O-acyltransferase [Neolewinella persica]
MLFTSAAFLILLVVTFVAYYLIPSQKGQVGLLICASLVFYAWNFPTLLLLLIASILTNWGISYVIVSTLDSPRRKLFATLGVALNLSILAFFKYSPLIGETFFPDTSAIGDFLLTIPLPIGISFFTFQGISLVVDTYRGEELQRTEATDRPMGLLANIAFYLAFFPQLIAGPIVKAHDFLPQIRRKFLRDIDWETAFRFMVTGYFLKMVIADNLKDYTYWMSYPWFQNLSVADLLVLLLGYSVQIFADFAGYSLIAIGIARLFGYVLMDNFDFPYIAKSFSEFWRRWHISLSTFLKEYLYFALGGNRHGALKTYRNLLLTMVLGGLWHGAAWSYAVWGAYHGMALALERLARDHGFRPLTNIWLRRLWVFGVVTVGWLLFRLPEFGHAILYLQKIFTNQPFGNLERLGLVLVYCLPVVFYHLGYLYLNKGKTVYRSIIQPLAYGLMIFLIFTNAGSSGDFIYFQF